MNERSNYNEKNDIWLLPVCLRLHLPRQGCGDKKEEQPQKAEATPATEPTVTASADLVDMEVSEEQNVMGEQTATASKVTIINQTGSL